MPARASRESGAKLLTLPLLDVSVRSRDGLTDDGLSSGSLDELQRKCWSYNENPHGHSGTTPHILTSCAERDAVILVVIGRGKGKGRERQRSLDW